MSEKLAHELDSIELLVASFELNDNRLLAKVLFADKKLYFEAKKAKF